MSIQIMCKVNLGKWGSFENSQIYQGRIQGAKKVITKFCKIDIIYITVITIIFADITAMTIVVFIINIADVALGYWSMMI